MPDFYTIVEKASRSADVEITVDFLYRGVKDIVIKGGEFRGFWDGTKWSLSLDDLIANIDGAILERVDKVRSLNPATRVAYGLMNSESSGIMTKFVNYLKKQTSSNVQFNGHILFSNAQPTREDYSTYQLPYTPAVGPTPNFDILSSVLYEQKELNKILWALGALFTGDISKIEKFLYLYGAKGTGKGTMLNIISDLIGEYWGTVDLQAITGASEFATADIQEVPVLIDSDSDISKISKEQNLLKLVSHEPILIRKLYKAAYPATFKGLLITASNERYKVKNIDSGITRRALVVHPTGKTIPMKDYLSLMEAIKFEIPHIAQKCIDVYKQQGMDYYVSDMDVEMIAYSDRIFDFVRTYTSDISNNITLKKATELYKLYLDDMGWSTTSAKRDLRIGLQRYFKRFVKDTTDGSGNRVRDYYIDFRWDVAFPEDPFVNQDSTDVSVPSIDLYNDLPSYFDEMCQDTPAQYTNEQGTPERSWNLVNSTLKDLDPSRLHYVNLEPNHIVIDFDIKNDMGEKDLEANLKAAAKFPETYCETSKSGGGLHLHYIYLGDTNRLANEVEPGIEIKVFNGNMSLRRKLIKNNNKPIAQIASGLPEKEEKMLDDNAAAIVWTEKRLRAFIENALNKEHHGATKPEIDFIKHVLDEAYESGALYDLRDMHQSILRFALHSSNRASECKGIVSEMKLCTIDEHDGFNSQYVVVPDEDIIVYDVEVFPNLVLVVWKRVGFEVNPQFLGALSLARDVWKFLEQWGAYLEDNKHNFGFWYNPSSEMIENLLRKPTMGFNNRKYDNHIVYGAMMGYSAEQTFTQSQNIINKNTGTFGGAYNVAYADLYEMMPIKQSLKKWEIQLGLTHDEFEFPWDQPLEFVNWARAGLYCWNDVVATEKLFLHPLGQEAYTARKILCELTGLPINTKTQNLAAAFLFGDDKEANQKFGWYDLSKEFPGYKFEYGKSSYLGGDPSEGGYVSSKPGVYQNVLYIDVVSMHPHSLIAMNYFGPYTEKFTQLVRCRVLINEGRFDEAAHAFDSIDPTIGDKLKQYLSDASMAKGLGYAMKIIINIVYGMTSAKYDNIFRDPRNIDNAIAKRGALFMMTLEKELTERGVDVVHVKTDSMKLHNWTHDDWLFCQEFAEKYGYKFSIECTFDRMALVNKATLIAQTTDGHWEAVGAQFAEPYVYKKLFTQEPIEETDFILTKSSTTPIYVGDMFIGKNAEVYPSKTGEDIYTRRNVDIAKQAQFHYDKEIGKFITKKSAEGKNENEIHNLKIDKLVDKYEVDRDIIEHVIASRTPTYTISKRYTIAGTTGYKWRLRGDFRINDVDMSYFKQLATDAVNDIAKVGDMNIMFHDNEDAQKFFVQGGE